MFSDGGARGNPGPAGIGVVITTPEGETIEISQYIGKATNNQAEYRALLEGVRELVKRKAVNVQCFLDSELLVKQLNREYRVKDGELGKLFLEVLKLTGHFSSITFTHVRRESNKEADRLVNRALDAHLRTRHL